MPLTFVDMRTGRQITAQPWQEALGPGSHYAIDGEPLVIGEVLAPARGYGEGFFWVRGYSVDCPDGEEGLFCCADATRPLRPEEFAALLAEMQTYA